MLPWTDRAGALSPLRLVVFIVCLMPATLLALALAAGAVGPKPLDVAIHETGEWSVRFLVATLAVTPLRRIGGWNRLIGVRRMLGLTALGYALVHLMLYVADMGFDLGHVASEILLRTYLLIGMVALIGLALLGTTSTDGWVRRLGAGWHRLHRLVYGLTALAVLHFFMQTKADAASATLIAGLVLLLLLLRLPPARGLPLSPPVLVAVALAATAGTMGLEYLWYRFGTGLPAHLVFWANFNPAAGIRPAWWVGAAGLALAGLALLAGRRRPPRRSAPLATPSKA